MVGDSGHLITCSLVFCLGGIFSDRLEEGTAPIRSRNLAAQNRLKRYHFPEEDPGVILVLVYDRAGQVNSRKEASGPRIGQDFRSHLYVSAGSGVTSHRTRCSGSIRSKFEFAGEQVLHPLVVCNHHHQIDRLATELKSPAATGDGDRGRCAPSVWGSARRYTLAVVPPNA